MPPLLLFSQKKLHEHGEKGNIWGNIWVTQLGAEHINKLRIQRYPLHKLLFNRLHERFIYIYSYFACLGVYLFVCINVKTAENPGPNFV